jgi:fructose transport system permease protein
VAEFDDHRRGLGQPAPARRCTRHPSLVPLIVLIVDLVFGCCSAQRFFSPFALTLILQQVQIVGICRRAQSLVILTAGIDLSVGAIMVLSSVVMGQFTFRYGLPPGRGLPAASPSARHICGFINGWLVAGEAAALHRHARHVADRARGQLPLFRQRDDPRPGHRGRAGPLLQFFGTSSDRRRVFTYGVIFMIAAGDRPGLCPAADRLGPACLCRRRRPGSGRTLRRPGQAHADLGLHAAGLICAFAGWALIGRIGSVSPTSASSSDRQHRIHHRRGDRRHLAVRRARLDPRGAVRRADRRRLSLGLRLLGADAQWTYLLIGVLIIAAVAVDQWIRKVSA